VLSDPQNEIRACIAYYQARGWDWTSAVGFIAMKALGVLPQDVLKLARKAKP
jgi:hypothetical protein